MAKRIKILEDIMRVEKKRYVSFGDFSVTDLISPVRLVRLRKRYGEQFEDDPMAKVAALIGTFIHEGVEKRLSVAQYLDERYILERTVSDVLHHGDKDFLISGRFDVLYDNEITDVKTCSVWKRIFDPTFKEWTQQQNIYANLLVTRGVPISKLKILAIYKDWSGGMAVRDKDYPNEMIEEIELPLWDWATSRMLMESLFEQHVVHLDTPDDELPECTADDRWERFSGGHEVEFALFKKPKAGRASKVIRGGSLADAALWVQQNSKGYTRQSVIEIRHAQRKRCEKYCGVKHVCNHFQEYMKKKGDKETLNEIITMENIL